MLEGQKALEQKLKDTEAKLKRATAFKLPEAGSLRSEVEALQAEAKELADKLLQSTKKVEGNVAEVSLDAQEMDGDGDEEKEGASPPERLSQRLNWEKIQAMSTEEKIALSQEAGPAFGLSVAIVALCYWSITLPILLNAYRESTGDWPRIEEIFSLADGGKAAGAVAGILGLTALLKPLRIAVAIAITPWTADNVLPKFPWLSQPQDQEDGPGRRDK
mmetsp:Transcript_6695/g.12144  ORF Transcript_6695/g.12144 Transcript_6695/m.12144 type:complete len:218 (+) Transcript_6695:27-680(+)